MMLTGRTLTLTIAIPNTEVPKKFKLDLSCISTPGSLALALTLSILTHQMTFFVVFSPRDDPSDLQFM